jgi:hypothetical protein
MVYQRVMTKNFEVSGVVEYGKIHNRKGRRDSTQRSQSFDSYLDQNQCIDFACFALLLPTEASAQVALCALRLKRHFNSPYHLL